MATSDLWHGLLQVTLSQNAEIYLKQHQRKYILHSNCLINLRSLVLAEAWIYMTVTYEKLLLLNIQFAQAFI